MNQSIEIKHIVIPTEANGNQGYDADGNRKKDKRPMNNGDEKKYILSILVDNEPGVQCVLFSQGLLRQL